MYFTTKTSRSCFHTSYAQPAISSQVLQACNRHLRVAGGFTGTTNVFDKNGAHMNDKMESFWLAETLKYLYLLFADDSLVSLEDYVFNTEAHPFRRQSSLRK